MRKSRKEKNEAALKAALKRFQPSFRAEYSRKILMPWVDQLLSINYSVTDDFHQFVILNLKHLSTPSINFIIKVNNFDFEFADEVVKAAKKEYKVRQLDKAIHAMLKE